MSQFDELISNLGQTDSLEILKNGIRDYQQTVMRSLAYSSTEDDFRTQQGVVKGIDMILQLLNGDN